MGQWPLAPPTFLLHPPSRPIPPTPHPCPGKLGVAQSRCCSRGESQPPDEPVHLREGLLLRLLPVPALWGPPALRRLPASEQPHPGQARPCPAPAQGRPAEPCPALQAYVEKYKFTSVVAQDLLDSFLSFFPELKEQSVDCRAGEARRLPRVPTSLPGEWLARGGGGPPAQDATSAWRSPTGSSAFLQTPLPHSVGLDWEAMETGGCVSQQDGARGASRRRWHLGRADLFRPFQEGAVKMACAEGLGQGRPGGGGGGLPQSRLQPTGLLM